MHPFDFTRATSVDDAIEAGSREGASFVAGGTNLVDHLKLGVARPTSLVDVSRVLDTDIRADGDVLRIGAGARNTDVSAHPLVRQHHPFLSQALVAGASGQLRNVATTGGNLLQRCRCPYFTDVTMPCNKREPGSGCPALEGFQRYHAILDTSQECIATHPSDMAVPLVALDAQVVVEGRDGQRRVALDDLYTAPADDPAREHVLEPGELITAVEVPLAGGANSRYRKVRDRASYAFALVSVAAALQVRGGIVREVRLAFGGVAYKPWRARTAERMLRDEQADRDHFRSAVKAELAGAQLRAGTAYKVPMLTSTAVSVLDSLSGEEL